ncbi:sn-glycerol-3-phosphate transport system permease protein ugpA [Mesomycoplasma dispar]|uniref:Sn-glycerol-3-phosphate transport system permease protein ugpA n=1 Tax=Mesomycoplasma dispar TaxID=86660 RepID=A0AAJ5NLR8_9BACT|nr:sugar ABC transporter permease [Mesomycoplasma dispar]ATP59888.1 sugar ABC transporter permease [Mesomycoplasma dispar]VEU62260.1 sn-glycerol-3-phosphate transport system permease protein ugpA [Mesomycoplasma dispar]
MNFISGFFYRRRIRKTNLELGILDQKQPFWKPFLALLPSILVIFLFTFLPFLYSVSKSLSIEINHNIAGNTRFGFDNFIDLITIDTNFHIAIRNSVIYSIVALPIGLIISLIIASTIASLHRKYARGFWQTVFFLPYVTSGIAVSVAFAYIFDSETGFINKLFGISTRWLNSGNPSSLNALFVVLISGVWRSLAFEVLILTTAMLSVNPTLYKAAAIDGASPVRQFFKITLPSVSRTINFLITIGIIGGIKVFPIGIFPNETEAISNGGSTLLIYIYKNVRGTPNFAQAGALTIYLFVFGVALSIVVKKFLSTIFLLADKISEKNVYYKIKNSQIH